VDVADATDRALLELALALRSAVEDTLAVAVDRGQELAILSLQTLATQDLLPDPARLALMRSGRLIGVLRSAAEAVPVMGGRVAGLSAFVAMRVGLTAVDAAREALGPSRGKIAPVVAQVVRAFCPR
jgi:hypothetical protein